MQPVQPAPAVPSPAAALQPQQHQTGPPSQHNPSGLAVRPAASQPAEQQPAPAVGAQPAGAPPANSSGAMAGPVGPAGAAQSPPGAQTLVATGQVRAAGRCHLQGCCSTAHMQAPQVPAAMGCTQSSSHLWSGSVSLQHLPCSPAHRCLKQACTCHMKASCKSHTPAGCLRHSWDEGPLLPCHASQRCSPLLHMRAPALVTHLQSPRSDEVQTLAS